MNRGAHDAPVAVIVDFLERAVQHDPQGAAIRILRDSRVEHVEYAQLLQRVVLFALHLRSTVGQKQNVGLLCDMDDAWLVGFFSILLSGNIVVPVNVHVPTDQMLRDLADSQVAAIVAAREGMPWAANVNAECPVLIEHHAMAAGVNIDESLAYLRGSITPDDIAVVVATSGTSGHHRWVILTHRNMVSDALLAVELIGQGAINQGESILAPLPPYHMYQVTIGCLVPMYFGAAICCVQDMRQLRHGFRLFEPAGIIAVPQMVEGLFKAVHAQVTPLGRLGLALGMVVSGFLARLGLDIRRVVFRRLIQSFGGRLRIMVSGGAFLSERYVSWFERIGVNLLVGYGITECSPLVSCNQLVATRKGSVGKTVDSYCQIRIDDGEILVKGPIVFQGYVDDPEATAACVVDGWFKTGDLGYIDPEGYLFITGRKKSLLVLSDGNNVAPEEIESLLEKHEIVEQALVALSDDRQAFLEAVVYVADSFRQSCNDPHEMQAMLSRIREQVNREVQPHKRLVRIAESSQPFSTNELGKVLRYQYVSTKGVFQDAG